MLTQETVIKHRDENKRVLSEVDRAHNEIITRKLDEVERRHKRISVKIKSLQDEKNEFLSGEVTNQELIENAKNSIRERKETFITAFLSKHLADCKAANIKPFSVRVSIPDSQMWELMLFGLSEDDLEKAVAVLPDGGMSAKERLSKVKAIDKEIYSLSKIITDELNAIKSQN